jgi:hypothetical protein
LIFEVEGGTFRLEDANLKVFPRLLNIGEGCRRGRDIGDELQMKSDESAAAIGASQRPESDSGEVTS